jgi:hypothetical protein
MAGEQRVGERGRDRSVLELVGERVDAEVTQVVTEQSRWLFDLARSRFQRCSLRQDWRQAMAFGTWLPYRRVRVSAGDLVVERDQHPALRAQLPERT